MRPWYHGRIRNWNPDFIWDRPMIRPMVETDRGIRFEVIEVEGREYLLGINKLTHKGDCANPIHYHNW